MSGFNKLFCLFRQNQLMKLINDLKQLAISEKLLLSKEIVFIKIHHVPIDRHYDRIISFWFLTVVR